MEEPHINTSLATVLIVNDMVSNLRVLTLLLQQQGYQVRAATSGQRALNAIALDPPDVIIFDVNLLDLPYHTIIDQLRSDDHTAVIPLIVASSAETLAEQAALTEDMPHVRYLQKPFGPQDVINQVAAALGRPPLGNHMGARADTAHLPQPFHASHTTHDTILIVDDIPDNLRLLATLLKERGYSVNSATNGSRALRAVQSMPPDLILLDINLPDMNGYDVCRQLQALPDTATIPVIFISAMDEVIDKLRAFEVGGVDYITKPFQMEEVLARVHTHLELRHSAQTLHAMNQQLHQANLQLEKSNVQLAHTVRDLEQRTNEMLIINQLGTRLHQVHTVDELWQQSQPFLRQLFAAQSGALFLRNTETKALEQVLTWGEHPPQTRTMPMESCYAYQTQPPSITDPSSQPLHCKQLEDNRQCPFPTLCVQLRTRDTSLGILHIRSSPASMQEQRATWQRLAVMVADILALNLVNIRLREDLRQQAIRDALTGLFNRRYLDEVLEREVQRARQQHERLHVLLLDVDHFKRVNDTFGHETGDDVLRMLGELLRWHLHGGDTAFRMGGEELVILLLATDQQTAYVRAEELRGVIAQQKSYRGRWLPSITVSIGLASFPDHGSQPEALLTAADEMLYLAKANGRNQVRSASLPLPADYPPAHPPQR